MNDRCLNKTGGGGVGACRTRNPGGGPNTWCEDVPPAGILTADCSSAFVTYGIKKSCRHFTSILSDLEVT